MFLKLAMISTDRKETTVTTESDDRYPGVDAPISFQRAKPRYCYFPSHVKLQYNDDINSDDFGTWSYQVIHHEQHGGGVEAEGDGYASSTDAMKAAMASVMEGWI